jgi:hypothetical protein
MNELSDTDKAFVEQVVKTAVDGLYADIHKCMDSLEKLTDPLADAIALLRVRVQHLEHRVSEK